MVITLHSTNGNILYVAHAVKIVGKSVLQEFLHICLGRCVISISELSIAKNGKSLDFFRRRMRIHNYTIKHYSAIKTKPNQTKHLYLQGEFLQP